MVQGSRARLDRPLGVIGRNNYLHYDGLYHRGEPAILDFAGIPAGPSTVPTILSAVFGSLLMGLYANRPIAVVPHVGENAFIAFGLAAMGIGWQQWVGAVFVSGVGFVVIALIRIRSWLANSISASIRHSFAVEIDLFPAFIGLYETGIATSFITGMPAKLLLAPNTAFLRAPDTPVKIGSWRHAQVLLAIFGFLVIAALLQRCVRGAILFGVLCLIYYVFDLPHR